MSWDQALEKEKECASTEFEGFWLSHQVRNGKKTAILAIMDEQGKRGKKGKEGAKQYFVYRPNTGQQVRQEVLAELKKKYKKVPSEECEEHWNKQFDSSAKTCSHAFWKGNCRSRTLGIECEVGLRKKAYNVLTGGGQYGCQGLIMFSLSCSAGSVLSVWTTVESVLTNDGQKKGTHAKMQVSKLSEKIFAAHILRPCSELSQHSVFFRWFVCGWMRRGGLWGH